MKLLNKKWKGLNLDEDSEKIKGQVDDIKSKLKFIKNKKKLFK